MSNKSNISNLKLGEEDDNAGKNWDDDDFEIPMLPPMANNDELNNSIGISGKRKISDLACDEGPVAGRTRKKMKPIALRTRSKSKPWFKSEGSLLVTKKNKKKNSKDVNDIAEEWIGKIGCEKTHGDFAIDDLEQFTRKK